MSEIWTPEQEALELEKRFKGIRQAAFAREHGVPGGPSMVSQHIKGRRPINMDAALAYAKGFGISLEEVSPRLAVQAASASTALGATDARHTSAPEPRPPSQDEILDGMVELLSSVPVDRRSAVADILAGWAREGGAIHWRAALCAVLSSEQRRAA